MQFDKVKEIIEDARKHGTVMAGGAGPEKGFFIRPTIVRDISDGTRLVDEEQFGPVLPVIKYSDPEDALVRANASPYGLGGSIWSSNHRLGFGFRRAHGRGHGLGRTSRSTWPCTSCSARQAVGTSAWRWAKKAWPSSDLQPR